jgi:DNA-binding HxlR family transcriptional regulator
MTTMTAAARRQQAREEFLEMMASCPSRQVLDALSDKWVTLVLHALADGPLRRGELSRAVAGATQKMLTQTLRELERDGILTRTITPEAPVRVEYELTPLGYSMLGLVRTIRDWADAHINEIEAARSEREPRRPHPAPGRRDRSGAADWPRTSRAGRTR